jgi:hypothetical protein
MSARRTLLMLAVLLGLGGYIYFIDLDRQRTAQDAKTLLQFDSDAVTQVALVYPDRELHLAKDDGGWNITAPLEARADTTAVDNLVNAVNQAEVSRTLDDPQPDLALYGLDSPAATVRLTLEDGTQLPLIRIGKDTPVGYSVYVQRAGEDAILLTPQALRLGMTKQTKDLRDKAVLVFQQEQVSQIEVQRPAEAETPVVLRKTDDGWTLDQPIPDRPADEASVNTFLSSLSGMRAQDFIEQPVLELKEFGLDPPQLAVKLSLDGDGEEAAPALRLLVGREKATDQGTRQRHIKREGLETLYLVGDWVFGDLNKTAHDFRDKTVARFAKEAVARIEVKRRDGEGFLLTCSDCDGEANWQIDARLEGEMKHSVLDQFVTDLHGLKGFEIVADQPQDVSGYGLDEPLVTIRAHNAAEDKLAGLLIGQTTQDDATQIFAMAEGGQTVFGLRDYVFERLNKKPADFWEMPATEDGQAAEAEAAPEEEQP